MRRTTRYFMGLAGATALALALIGHALATHTTAAVGRVTLPQSVPAAVKGATSGAPLATTTPLAITVALRSRDAAALARFTTAVVTPGNPLFRHFLTPATFGAAFAPAPAEVSAVRAWLSSNGWHVTRENSGGLFISATGTAAEAQATFGVHLWQYLGKDGTAFFGNADAIGVPAALAPNILAVTGLDSAPRAHSQHVLPKDKHGPVRTNATSCPTASNSSFIPAQLAKAYEFPTAAAAHSARMALVELDGYIPADISAFAKCFVPGVNTNTLVQVRPVDARTALPAGDAAVEVELDIEIALGLAPGMSGMDVYEAPNTGAGWLDLFAAIANDNRDGTVSVSWGGCEGNLDSGQANAENVIFQQMVAQGQGVYVAAGDTGAYDCLPNDGTGQGDQSLSADDPSANPNVIAVGGTALQTGAGGTYGSEAIWNNSPDGTFAAGGGGTSVVWQSPAWQAQSLATPSTSVGRALPDVTADADPNTGYAIYCTERNGCGGIGWLTVGGTSAAAPLWAALATLANGMLGSRVGLITPALYNLYGADANGQGGIVRGGTTYVDYAQGVSGATSGTPTFHDVTTGNNSFPAFTPGYAAALGFDRASGIGSMHGRALIGYLTNLGTGTPPPTP
ncbi:MAG: S8/S53 family peptidase, partial [Ktedonobacterales bacterium]|nr:S8/S53 family peptidase [Ktedonobacterales bacterium]